MSIAKSCQVQTLDNGAAEVLFVEREPAPRTPPKVVSSKASPMRQRPLLKPRLFRASSDSAALLSEKKDALNAARSVPVPVPVPPRKIKSSSQLETFDGGNAGNTILPPRWSRPRGRRDSSVQKPRSRSPAGADECESRIQAEEEEEPEETTTSKRPPLEGRTEEDHTEDRATEAQPSPSYPATPRARENPCQTFQLRILQGKHLSDAVASRCRVLVQDKVIAEQSLSVAPSEEATTSNTTAGGGNSLGGLPITLEVRGHLSNKICVQLLTPMAATSQMECTLQELLVSNPKAYPNQWRTLQPVVVEAETNRATSPKATTTSASPYFSEDQQSTSSVHLPSLQMRLSKLSHPSWGVVRETVSTMGNKVWLHVYDVTKRSNVQNVNALLKPMGMGGLYHAAIEIHGREYSFGGSQDSQGTGIYAYLPKQCPWHNYRESVYLGECELSKKQVRAVLKSMEPRWMATSYNLFRKNCCGFSEEFAKELGVNTLPRWLHVLAEKTVHLEPLLQGIDRCQPFIGLQLSSLDSMNVNSDITSVNCDQILAVQ